MSEQPWTIERICDALGNPDAARVCRKQIYSAPAHELLGTFAKWQSIAERTIQAVQRGREYAAIEAAGGEIPGEWVDMTDEVLATAARIRARGAA